jgi:predicted GNAT family acetyltransferase
VEEALRYAQLNNYMVVPTCSFTADFMDNHHEYAKMRVEA